MKNITYKLSLITLCFIIFQACQSKPQEVSQTEKKAVKNCYTTHTSSEIVKKAFSDGNLNRKPSLSLPKSY